MRKYIAIILSALMLIGVIFAAPATAADGYKKGTVVKVSLVATEANTPITGVQGKISYGSSLSYVAGSFNAPHIYDMESSVNNNPILFSSSNLSQYELGTDKIICSLVFQLTADASAPDVQGSIDDIYRVSGINFITIPNKSELKIEVLSVPTEPTTATTAPTTVPTTVTTETTVATTVSTETVITDSTSVTTADADPTDTTETDSTSATTVSTDPTGTTTTDSTSATTAKTDPTDTTETDSTSAATVSTDPTDTTTTDSASATTAKTDPTDTAETDYTSATTVSTDPTDTTTTDSTSATTAKTDPTDITETDYTSATTVSTDPTDTTTTDSTSATTAKTDPTDITETDYTSATTVSTDPTDTTATDSTSATTTNTNPIEAPTTESTSVTTESIDTTETSTTEATDNTTASTVPTDKYTYPSRETIPTIPFPFEPTTVATESPLSKGADEKTADKAIKSLKNDKDPDGSNFALLAARTSKTAKTSITVKWNKVKNASKYVIYGNRCGKAYKKIKTVKKTTFKQTKLKKGKYYKYLIIAVDKNGKVVTTSKTIHAATKGGSVGNAKKITFKNVTKNSKKLAKGANFTLKTKITAESKKLKIKNHRKVKFESSNPKIAKVNGKGKITAKKKGTANVYAYAQNGVAVKVKVTVK